MKDQIRAEMRKLRTTRSLWGLLAGAMILAGVAAWAMVSTAAFGTSVALTTLPGFAEMMVIVPIFVVVLGIRSYTDEVRHGVIVPTLLTAPRRRLVVAAKAVVLSAAAVMFALACTAVVGGVSLALLAVDGVAVTVSLASLAVLVGKAVAICVLWSSIGLGLGLIVRHQVAAIVGSILWMLLGESLVEMLVGGVSKFLPAHASTSVLGIVPADMSVVTPAVGAALLGGWALLSLAAGSRALAGRDIA